MIHPVIFIHLFLTFQDFLGQLDSRKPIVLSLNLLSKLFVDLDTPAAAELRAQLVSTNRRFDVVCERAARRHDQLQRTLVDSGDLYKVIQDLFRWLEETELQVRSNEPVDLSDEEGLREKYQRLKVCSLTLYQLIS